MKWLIWLMLGLFGVGLVLALWNAQDLNRYMKIRKM